MTVYTSHTRRRRRKSNMRLAVILLVAVCAIFISARFMLARDRENRIEQHRQDLTYIDTPEGIDSELIEYKGMTVSFNPKLHIPNWVAWELTEDEAIGAVARSNNFARDERVKGCPDPSEYTGSGYDRGHMAPAGDMKWDRTAMEETFYLTNILPQDGTLNKGTWKNIEDKCRARVTPRKKFRGDSAIVIICGPVPGDTPVGYIGKTRVAVPRRLFKVILAPYAEHPYAIGFLMDNARVPGGMQAAAMSVDEVERITGYDFFAALPDDIENKLESQCNFTRWSRLK